MAVSTFSALIFVLLPVEVASSYRQRFPTNASRSIRHSTARRKTKPNTRTEVIAEVEAHINDLVDSDKVFNFYQCWLEHLDDLEWVCYIRYGLTEEELMENK